MLSSFECPLRAQPGPSTSRPAPAQAQAPPGTGGAAPSQPAGKPAAAEAAPEEVSATARLLSSWDIAKVPKKKAAVVGDGF